MKRLLSFTITKANKTLEKPPSFADSMGEGSENENDGDAEPVWTFTAPRQSDSQSGNEVTIVGSILGGAENSDVKIEVSLDPLVLEYTPTQKITQKTIGKYNVSEGLGDGSGFSMTLDISDLYSTSG